MKTLALSFLLPLLAGPGEGGAFYTIAPGIILDEARSRIYLMDRVGRMCALELRQGTVLWRSAEATMPLGLLDDGALIALDGRKGPGGMRLLALDADSGALRAAQEIALPAEVRARARPGVADRFEVVAAREYGVLRLRWHYERKPLRGAPALAAEGEPAPALLSRAGSITVSWNGEVLHSAGSEPLPDDAAPFTVEALTGPSPIPEEDGARLLAADGQAVLASRAQDDPRYGMVFRWRVYRLDGTLLGELPSHYGSAPFIVREPLLLYRRNPILLLGGDGAPVLEQGSRLIAWDLAAGRERWAFDVAERQYFGPLPP